MREYKGIRPIIGVPLERALSYAGEVVPWMLALAQWGIPFIRQEPNRTDVARNEFAEHLLKNPEFTHLVMLDVDHEHRTDVIHRLCKSASEGRQIVTAASFRRGKPYELIGYTEEDGKFFAVTEWEKDQVLEVQRIGLGAVIIAREVFETIPWPWFKYEYPERGQYPTEDTWFSKQCLAYGYRLFVDTRIRNDHLSTARVNESVFRGYLELEQKRLNAQAEG